VWGGAFVRGSRHAPSQGARTKRTGNFGGPYYCRHGLTWGTTKCGMVLRGRVGRVAYVFLGVSHAPILIDVGSAALSNYWCSSLLKLMSITY